MSFRPICRSCYDYEEIIWIFILYIYADTECSDIITMGDAEACLVLNGRAAYCSWMNAIYYERGGYGQK